MDIDALFEAIETPYYLSNDQDYYYVAHHSSNNWACVQLPHHGDPGNVELISHQKFLELLTQQKDKYGAYGGPSTRANEEESLESLHKVLTDVIKNQVEFETVTIAYNTSTYKGVYEHEFAHDTVHGLWIVKALNTFFDPDDESGFGKETVALEGPDALAYIQEFRKFSENRLDSFLTTEKYRNSITH